MIDIDQTRKFGIYLWRRDLIFSAIKKMKQLLTGQADYRAGNRNKHNTYKLFRLNKLTLYLR